MLDPREHRPQVLVHCALPRDGELISQLLEGRGIDHRSLARLDDLRGLLEAEHADLILTDSAGGIGPLGVLLDLLDDRPQWADLPMVLLATPEEMPHLSKLTARRFNAVLLTKPMGREQLITAVESGLRLRARQREVRDLLAQLSASNDQLASANQALEERRQESVEEAHRKTRFLAAISHDIRTPVNALVLSCQLLHAIGQASPVGAIDVRDIDDLTGALLSNASALVELVNDLLDIARYDQGKLEFTETEFPLGEFVEATVGGLRPLADEKRLELAVEVADPGAVLRTDRVKLARIVQNLVANAIKFTEAGQVRVSVRATTAAGMRLSVADTGIGIPPALREEIFDEFAQLRNPERDRTKGTGLGLAICRRLVVAMGGTIAVDPEPRSAGTSFVVTLPPVRVLVDDRPEPGPAAAAPPPASARLRAAGSHSGEVLVVEDHEPSRVLLQRLLRQAGLTVRTAENGAEALQQIQQARPNLVLMDLMMPVMGGLEALRILREQPATRDLTVIILTGDINVRDDPTGQPFEGASAYLSKPVEVPTLHEMLDRFLAAATPTA